ncbi:hypothetical protein [Actinocorallia sp. A-T 12471]|uniref:hypothetical protein n=1 Tax=Actinocorallia sp. A-T 12471 TaxID=3089813 RepID=UPI0029CE08F4|nr:hypothetical protein [Actinocorallia sp. A-T 12471]MDX6742834.1 hypothetical protein [Actinocorallia sp. A-T 12471]
MGREITLGELRVEYGVGWEVCEVRDFVVARRRRKLTWAEMGAGLLSTLVAPDVAELAALLTTQSRVRVGAGA